MNKDTKILIIIILALLTFITILYIIDITDYCNSTNNITIIKTTIGNPEDVFNTDDAKIIDKYDPLKDCEIHVHDTESNIIPTNEKCGKCFIHNN